MYKRQPYSLPDPPASATLPPPHPTHLHHRGRPLVPKPRRLPPRAAPQVQREQDAVGGLLSREPQKAPGLVGGGVDGRHGLEEHRDGHPVGGVLEARL